MKKLLKGLGLTLALMIFSVSMVQARTAYVSDTLVLTFREGPGTQYKVIKSLISNTEIRILEEDQGFYKVQIDTGEQGWVDKRFVAFETPKPRIIEALTREKEALENQLKALSQDSGQFVEEQNATLAKALEQAEALEAQIKELEQEKQNLSARLTQTQQDLENLKQASSDVVTLQTENQTLARDNQQLSQALARAKDANGQVYKTGMIKWFLAGVGVLLLGWIFGLMLSSKKKKSSSLLD